MIQSNICSNTASHHTQKFGIRILTRSTGITLKQNTCENNGQSVSDQIVVAGTASVNGGWKTANTLSYGGITTTIP
jgi:hypothetical protein